MNWAEIWRGIIQGEGKSWVAFSEGTCVIVSKPEDEDLGSDAAFLLAQWGPVHAGTPSGDFNVITLDDNKGWVVTCHHPDILSYVAPDEVPPGTNDMFIGLLGRAKRHDDSYKLLVAHIEDKR